MQYALLLAGFVSIPLTYASPLAHKNMDAEFVKSQLEKREDGLTNPIMNEVPTCKGKDHDPTWTKGPSQYQDDTGTFVGKDCGMKDSKNECWTDYMVVGTKSTYAPWKKAMGNIDCPEGGDCSQALGKLTQSCTAFTWSVTETIGAEFDLEIFKVSAEVSSTQGQTRTQCSTDSTTNTCTWKDSACHSIWKSEMTTTVFGYMRRSCTEPSHSDNANMKESAQRADGFFTRGMTDFQFDLPGITAVNCDGSCASDYLGPGDLPTADGNGELVPWTG